MKTLITIGLFFLAQCAIAQQDAKAFLDKVKQYYRDLENMELKIDYHIYNNHNTAKITETAQGHYIKKGDAHYLKQYGTTMILVKDDLLVKDDSTKLIVWSKANRQSAKKMNQMVAGLENYTHVQELKKKNGNRHLALVIDPNKPSDIDKVEVEVDEETLRIKTMTLYYRKQFDVSDDPRKPVFKQPRMKIVYRYFSAIPNLKKNPFQLDQYLTTDSSGKKKLTAAYSTYEFIHQ